MTQLTNDFEGGTNGTTITSANSGGTSGTAFDSTTIGTGATLTYDSTHAAHGSLSMKVATGSTSSSDFAHWGSTTLGGTISKLWFRVYLYFAAMPAATTGLMRFEAASGQCARLDIDAAGNIEFRDSGNSVQLTSTATVPTGAWFRVEGFCTASATAGQLEFKLFTTSMDEVTPDETQTSGTALNTGAGVTAVDWGIPAGVTNTTYWEDDVATSDVGYIGPAVVNVTSSGSLALSAASMAGTASVPITSTGSLSLSDMAMAGTAFTGQAVTSSGSLSLSGLSPSVDVTVPPEFPTNPLGILVELLLNGTWTDITTFVYWRAGISLSNGRPDESSTIQAAALTLTLNNQDGSFTPKNASGNYYPYIVRNTQIRVSVFSASSSGQTYSGYRFWGEVSAWPPKWDPSGTDVYAEITAAGYLRRLNQGSAIGSATYRYVTSLVSPDAPLAYWPGEDGSSATQIASAVSGVGAMSITGSPSLSSDTAFGGSDPLPQMNGSVFTGAAGAYSSGSQTFTSTGIHTWTCPGGITSIQVECWGGGGGGGNAADNVGASAGDNGTSSYFIGDSVTVTANPGHGGGGGGHGGLGSGGSGGSGSSAPVHFSGGAGHAGGSGPRGGGGGGSGGTASAGNDAPSPPSGATAVSGGGPGGNGNNASSGGNGKTPSSGPGGGGGGADAASTAAGGGGGGGEYARNGAVAVTPGKTYTLRVGPGGSGAGGTYAGGNGYAGKVALTYSASSVPNANCFRFLLDIPSGGGVSGAVYARFTTAGTIARADVVYSTGGKLQLIGYNSGGTALFTSTAAGAYNGVPVVVSVELTPSGTSVAWALKTAPPGINSAITTVASGTLASATLGGVSNVYSNPNGTETGAVGIGHFIIHSDVPSIIGLAAAASGYTGELAGDRFARLCNEEAIGFSLVDPARWYFEDSTDSWTGSNATIAQSTAWNDPGDGGVTSLLITSSGAAGNWYAFSPSVPVLPGEYVTVNGTLYTPAALGAVGLNIDWLDATKTYLSTTSGSSYATSNGQVIYAVTSGAAPASAAFYRVTAIDAETVTAGKLLYVDYVRGGAAMGPQVDDKLVNVLQAIEDLDRGLLSETTSMFGLGYRTLASMRNQTAVLTLDYSLAELAGSLEPTYDDQLTRNDVTVSRTNGSSVEVVDTTSLMSVNDPPNGVGSYTYSLSVAAESDAQLQGIANWILTLGTVDEERYPVVTVDLRRSEVASLFATVPALVPGDFFQITNPPPFLPASTIKQLAYGFAETLNNFEWNIEINAVPESAYGS